MNTLRTIGRIIHVFKAVLFRYGYFGNYKSWFQAMNKAGGYEDSLIRDKVLKASMQVKKGEMAFERDGVAFPEPEYEWPLLASLLWVASLNDNKLRVLDFGGAMGSHYFQHKMFFDHLDKFKWDVVEQRHFVEAGWRYFANEDLGFYRDIDEVPMNGKPNVLLLGCVLPYLDDPYYWLKEFRDMGIEYVLIDKHPVTNSSRDRLTVQRINPRIYKASYPAWFFSESVFLNFMFNDFELIYSYLCPDLCNVRCDFKGYLFRRKK